MNVKKSTLIKSGSKLDLFLERHLTSSYFSYREILAMLTPLIMDQFFISIIGLLTTAMISSSSQESVSAVSLVSPLYMMIYAVFSAISAGGTVVVAQYKGRGAHEKMRRAAGQVVFTTCVIAIISCIILVFCAGPLINMLYSSASAIVLAKSKDYLIGIAISLVFLSFYMGAFAVFRGIGETKVCLYLSMIINLIHLFASFLFINILNMDILGTTLSLNIARFVGGVVAIYALMSKKSSLQVGIHDIFHFDFPILKAIFRISFPFALEQLFFNGGTMLVQTYIVVLGTISVASNAVANSAFSILYSVGMAVCTLSITVVGQCIGAGNKEEATRYGKKMVWLGVASIIVSIIIFLPAMPLILKLYQAPAENLSIIYKVLIIAIVPMPFFWSMSNVMPSVLRSAGDAAFSSFVSLITMWVIRVGLGYVFALPFGLGLNGVWICMGIEWAVRTLIFYFRFRSNAWLTKKALD